MRTLSANLGTAIAEDITQPYYLVEMEFATVVRYSSAGLISWDSKTWNAAGLQVRGGNLPVITVFNEGTTFGQTVLTDGTAGRAITIYRGYRNDADHPAPIEIFSGQMSEAVIGQYVTIRTKKHAPARTPRHYVGPPTFNHITPAGTKFETPKRIIILE